MNEDGEELEGNVGRCDKFPLTLPNLDRSKNNNMEGSPDAKPHNSEGGRLQFYLDGKVVLELSDRRENGKSWWVPVTQKTYWPPPPSCSTPGSTVRQESGASFSVSDESSVQSQASPWLRETRWKNPNPSKHPTANLKVFFFYDGKPKNCRCQLRLRRRPFNLSKRCHLRRSSECAQCKVTWKKRAFVRPNVAGITLRLLEKALQNKKPSSSSLVERNELLVSPKKRIDALREGNASTRDRPVHLQDQFANASCSATKKAKAVIPPVQSQCSGAAGAAEAVVNVYDRMSSYSIDSLLNSKERHESTVTSTNSEFLRSSLLSSLRRKVPSSHGCSGSIVNDTSHSNLDAAHTMQLLSQPRHGCLPVSVAVDTRGVGVGMWLPQRHPHPMSYSPRIISLTATSASALALATRSVPSSSRLISDNVESEGMVSESNDTPPKCDDVEDVPLNLTTVSRAREHS